MGGSQLIMRFFGMNGQHFNHLMDRWNKMIEYWQTIDLQHLNPTIMSQPTKELQIDNCTRPRFGCKNGHLVSGGKNYGDRWPWPGIFLVLIQITIWPCWNLMRYCIFILKTHLEQISSKTYKLHPIPIWYLLVLSIFGLWFDTKNCFGTLGMAV